MVAVKLTQAPGFEAVTRIDSGVPLTTWVCVCARAARLREQHHSCNSAGPARWQRLHQENGIYLACWQDHFKVKRDTLSLCHNYIAVYFLLVHWFIETAFKHQIKKKKKS